MPGRRPRRRGDLRARAHDVGASPAATRTARTATWLAAALTVGSVPLHAWVLTTSVHGLVLTALMALMVLWCQWCAVDAVRAVSRPAPSSRPGHESRHQPPFAGQRPRRRRSHFRTDAPHRPLQGPLRQLWIMALAMALLHVGLLTGFPAGAHQHPDPQQSGADQHADAHQHAGQGVGAGPDVGPDAGAGPMLAVVVLELVVCFACAVALREKHQRLSARRGAAASL